MSITSRGLLPRIAAAFLMTSSMTVAAVSLTQSAYAFTQAQQEAAFWKAGYAYCDAEKLGQYWGMDTYSAKLNAGNKILIGDQRYLDEAIAVAIQSYTCPNGFNFDDSKDVAALWDSLGQS
ncbi:hypothetical protein sos41_42420 [Alphaproteobacteria bacterium SO-S41]|nr:hypothetical protein sos41_42420 [Alphaproteobacteria bacterium SO-S41]